MRKYLIFFGVIVICVIVFLWKKDRDAKGLVEYDLSGDDIGRYTQILLKKWEENNNWQEQAGNKFDFVQNPWRDRTNSGNAWDTADKVLKEYYNITSERGDFKGIMVPIGGEYWLVCYRRLSNYERIWILISHINGNFLSTCKDTLRIAKRR